ncbi:hypothetical protein KUL152_08270 [Tenacibaculum sp. KUL152]|nr:hypothetical protein KUL152_08270 [Tenacibaculum sp. KUL152]
MIRAVKIFLLGLFFGPLLAELLGFITPFIMVASDDMTLSLLPIANYLGALSSVVFAAALLTASFSSDNLKMKIWSTTLAVIYVLSSSYIFFEVNTPLEAGLYGLNYFCDLASLITGGILIMTTLQNQQAKSTTPNA